MGLQDWDALIAIGGAVFALAVAFHVRVVKPARKSLHDLSELIPIVQYLKAELSTNGGQSIKDKINRMAQDLRVLKLHDRISSDNSPQCLFETDAEGRCTYVNAALAALFSMSRDEMLGNGWLKAIPPDERVEQWTGWMDAVKAGIPYDSVYNVVNPRHAVERLVRATAVAITDDQNHVIGYYGLVQETHAR